MKLNGLSYKCFAPQSKLEPIQVRDKKSLKIPTKDVIRIVSRRRTDNTMTKKKVQKDKQRSTTHTYKTKYRVTRHLLKPGVNSNAPEG